MTFRQLLLVIPDFADAPAIGSATAGNTQALVYFTAPVSNGGATITAYTATSSPGGFTGTAASSPVTVTGLTNGTNYTFTVTATNSFGIGPASSASNAIVPVVGSTVPDAPTIGTATGGTNASVSVTFTAPASDGGSVITSYTVQTVTPVTGAFTASGAASPISVTGLTNGTAYTFQVWATNAIGSGTTSNISNSATPSTVPGAPTIGTATKGNVSASVAFTAPASNGGAAITGYTATSSPGGFTGTGASSPLTVSGLTNGTPYTFTVRATNVSGNSAASAASNSATPSTVPGAPTIGTAQRQDSAALVAFTAPASTGGAAITGYTATSNIIAATGSGSTSPVRVTGLTNGTAYTFTVVATNANGSGAASAASNSVTPAVLVSIVNQTISKSGAGAGQTAGYRVNTSGIIESLKGGVYATLETWLVNGVASDYEVYFTAGGKSPLTTGTTGAWLALSSSREVTLTTASASDTLTATVTVQIRQVSTGVVQDTASIDLSATSVY